MEANATGFGMTVSVKKLFEKYRGETQRNSPKEAQPKY